MLSGYNHNIPYKNRIFHIQTEDGGPANSVLTTTVFLDGAVVASRRTDYGSRPGGSPDPDALRNLMETQHRTLARELRSGAYDESIRRLLTRGRGGTPGDAP